MAWAVLITTCLFGFALLGGILSNAGVRQAEDNWNVVAWVVVAIVLFVVDFILVLIWLAKTAIG